MQDVLGILGESVMLPLGNQSEVKADEIFWSSGRGVIARTKLGQIDRVFAAGFMNRLRVPAGSFSLQILNLREEDGGYYRAQTTLHPPIDTIQWEYKLEVFKRLPKPDIKVFRSADTAGSKTCKVTLICTVETGSEGASYTWTGEVSGAEKVGSVLNLSLTPNERSLTFTCTARNPVSANSTRVRPWESCGKGKVTWQGISAHSMIFIYLISILHEEACIREKGEVLQLYYQEKKCTIISNAA
ncbi:SLAM family member 5-like [Rhinatrema bivittatum]|uniref:SLAM family member 5-like n=1 Tax=Rhinatrema bivittatum TaxID=194408 RepID=UPI00112B4DD2|nr:SLAM family member 5-like [Rhinatrema bivittatum]